MNQVVTDQLDDRSDTVPVSKPKKVPKLRFPGFNGEWQPRRLGEVVKFKNGKPFEDEVIVGGRYNLITIDSVSIDGDLKNKFKHVDRSDGSLKAGDLVVVLSDIAHGYLLGLTAEIPSNEFVLNQRMGRLRPIADDSLSFLRYYINLHQSFFRKRGQGTSQRHIYERDIVQLPVLTPSTDEQRKIAEFLTVVDERIGMSERKLKLLRNYKQGVMQKIFTQQLRFKETGNKHYPDWQPTKLSSLCSTIKSGGTPTATNRAYYEDGEIPFLSISDMTEQGKYLSWTSKKITETGLKNSASWIVPENSVVYSMYASVGLPAINKLPIATSQAVINLVPNQKTNSEFLYYFLLNYKRQVLSYVETGTQGNINAQTVKNILVGLPSTQEQQKIAGFLTALDDKIKLEESKLEQAKQFKKSLLQQLFV